MPFVAPTKPTRCRLDATKYAILNPNGTGMVHYTGEGRADDMAITWSVVDGKATVKATQGTLAKKVQDALLKALFVPTANADRPDATSRQWRNESGVMLKKKPQGKKKIA